MPRRKKVSKRRSPKKRKKRGGRSRKKSDFLKSLRSSFKKKTKFFWKNKIQWYLFFLFLGIAGMFLFFQDYRADAQKFESVVRAAAKNTKEARVVSKRVIPRENWRAKWNEVHLVVRLNSNKDPKTFLKTVKRKLPGKFKLYREVATKTGTANSVSTEFRRKNIPVGFLRIEAPRKYSSTEYLAEEREVVRPKKIFQLPKIKKKPKKEAAPPSKVKKPVKKKRIAIVIDDVGNSSALFPDLFSMPKPLTIAVLPKLSLSKEAARLGSEKGYEVILHQPVEALHHNEVLGPGGIFTGQSAKEIQTIVGRNLDSLPGITGSNNHMGSRGTQDLKLMKSYAAALKKRKLFYLDSWTTRKAVGKDAARSVGIPYLRRTIFLDNIDSKDAIRKQVNKLIEEARREGSAIGIGHMRKNTLTVLRQMIPEIKKKGIQIVRLKDLL